MVSDALVTTPSNSIYYSIFTKEGRIPYRSFDPLFRKEFNSHDSKTHRWQIEELDEIFPCLTLEQQSVTKLLGTSVTCFSKIWWKRDANFKSWIQQITTENSTFVRTDDILRSTRILAAIRDIRSQLCVYYSTKRKFCILILIRGVFPNERKTRHPMKQPI